MHVLVCVFLCTRHMLPAIVARLCLRVSECVLGLVQGAYALTVIAARRCMHVCGGAVWACAVHADCDCCEAMHACVESLFGLVP